jgi:AcrR family transcriptional regulator
LPQPNKTTARRPVRRPDRRIAKTRTALLEAGRALLTTRSIDVISIDEIVAAADVAKGSFYNHFTDKDVFAREIGATVRRQVEKAVATGNAGVADPAARFARALCVFIRFAIEHRDSAQLLWRLNSGATMADAPVNRQLREELLLATKSPPFSHLDLETGVLLIMGASIISIRHVLEERVVTPPAQIAANMAAVMLRGLGVTPRRAQSVANMAAEDILGKPSPSR